MANRYGWPTSNCSIKILSDWAHGYYTDKDKLKQADKDLLIHYATMNTGGAILNFHEHYLSVVDQIKEFCRKNKIGFRILGAIPSSHQGYKDAKRSRIFIACIYPKSDTKEHGRSFHTFPKKDKLKVV